MDIQPFEELDQYLNRLINDYKNLKQQNQNLHTQVQTLQQERHQLQEKNQVASQKITQMISRLKSMQNTSEVTA